jgi:class 3 adenylate cyclase
MDRKVPRLELERRVFYLKTLHDTSLEIAKVREPREILNRLLMMAMGNFGAASGVISICEAWSSVKEEIVHRGMADAEIERITKAVAKRKFSLFKGENAGGLPRPVRIFVPFEIDGEVCGWIGLGKKISGEPYTPDDRELLGTMVAQGSAALGNARLMEQLGRRAYHLKTLYDVSQEIDFLREPGEILRQLLMMTIGNFGAKSGVVLLINRLLGRVDAISHRGLDDESVGFLQDALGAGSLDGTPGTEALSSLGMRIWIPFSVNEVLSGGIGLGEKILGDGYSKDDRELLDTMASQGAAAIRNALLLDRMKKEEIIRVNFSRYLSPQIVDRIVKHDVQVNLGGDRKVVTVLFSDIRNFTAITESRPPDQLVAILNEYFTEMAKIIFENQGSLDKYIGDAIVAVFGSLVPLENPARNAVEASIQMMKRLPDLNERWRKQFNFSMHIGIGVNTGEVFLGNIGSPERMEFTVIGDAVNVASRLSGLAKKGQILVTRETLALLGPGTRAQTHPPAQVKGKTAMVDIYEVLHSGNG